MRIGFHSNQLDIRGSSVALFDYADFNRSILGNESIIFTSADETRHHPDATKRFNQEFKVCMYGSKEELISLAKQNSIEVMYFEKQGDNDGLLVPGCKNVVHAVFQYFDPHGDVYAYISEWLSNYTTQGKFPFVPYIVRPPPNISGDLRAELGIPQEATVFGRHGGSDSFDLPIARAAVEVLANQFPHLYFVFLNTDRFCAPNPRIIHLEGTSDLLYKQKFINTCDCMLHARVQGETFGLAVAEFSVSNKRVMTFGGSRERCHIDILGNKGIIYNSAEELVQQILLFDRNQKGNFDAYSAKFSPAVVMEKFRQVFLS